MVPVPYTTGGHYEKNPEKEPCSYHPIPSRPQVNEDDSKGSSARDAAHNIGAVIAITTCNKKVVNPHL
jgi:hypothetical protein